jgi:hypothetical protein
VNDKVDKFALDMDRVLNENIHKGGWSGASIQWLINRAEEELRELDEAWGEYCMECDPKKRHNLKFNIIKESLDVANFCMMIYDNIKQD